MPLIACAIAFVGMSAGYMLEPLVHDRIAPEPYPAIESLKTWRGTVEEHDPSERTLRIRMHTPHPDFPSIAITVNYDENTRWFRKTLHSRGGIVERNVVTQEEPAHDLEGQYIDVYVPRSGGITAGAQHILIHTEAAL